jgi:hypothetical protein
MSIAQWHAYGLTINVWSISASAPLKVTTELLPEMECIAKPSALVVVAVEVHGNPMPVQVAPQVPTVGPVAVQPANVMLVMTNVAALTTYQSFWCPGTTRRSCRMPSKS